LGFDFDLLWLSFDRPGRRLVDRLELQTRQSVHAERFTQRLRRGADEVVVSENLEFGAEVWRLTEKRGVDIVLDNVGATLGESVRALSHGGIAVVLGNLRGEAVSVSPALLIGKRLRAAGSGRGTIEDLHQALALLTAGFVKPVVSEVMRGEEAARAHSLLESRGAVRRVVVEG
jgi:acryloyl-coenzyme A reductase